MSATPISSASSPLPEPWKGLVARLEGAALNYGSAVSQLPGGSAAQQALVFWDRRRAELDEQLLKLLEPPTPATTEQRANRVAGFLEAIGDNLRDAGDHTFMSLTFRCEQWRELGKAIAYVLRDAALRQQLERARDAAIAHIGDQDVAGALTALTLQRDAPELFDRSTFTGEATR